MYYSMILKSLQIYLYYASFMFIKLVLNFCKSRIYNYKALGNIKGKYVVITGATDGIGKSLAFEFAKRKYNLIIFGRNESKLQTMKEEIIKNNVTCITILKDFSQDIDFPELVDYDIGLLINNVGLCSDGPRMFINDIRYQDILNVNIKNTFKLTQMVLMKMMQNKKGYVVNIGSLTGDLPMPMFATYASSKAMIKSWTESLHTECLPWNLNVELMNTGYVATKMSGIKRSSLFCPSPECYAKSIANHFGSSNESFAYFPHLIFYFVLCLIPRSIVAKVNLLLQYKIRDKMDKKRQAKRE